MPTYPFRLITPNGKIFDDQIQSLVAPGLLGSFGVLANHTPMVASLAKGVLVVEKDQEKKYFVIGPGVLEVGPRTNVLLLSDYACAADTKEAAEQRGKTLEPETFRDKPRREAKGV